MTRVTTAPQSGPNPAAPLLSVKDLNVSFRNGRNWTQVLHNVSLSVNHGETLAVIGESGSGKSVTSLAIMRLLNPNMSRCSGSITFAGKDMLSLGENEVKKIRGCDIGMIFQEPMTSLNPVMKVGTQIMESLRIHSRMDASSAEAEAMRILDRVRIPAARDRFHEYPHKLSGGMRQRVMIAMALACRPKLLIADEPTTALDVTIQAQILTLMRILQEEEKLAILLVTHDMGVVAEMADRVTVMRRGRVQETGELGDVFRHPRAAYTKALLSSVPRLGELAGTSVPRRFDTVDPDADSRTVAPESRDTVQRGSEPLLRVRNLCTYFDIRGGLLSRPVKRVHAVENVSFDLMPGETLAIVGESGCGKSSLGRSLLRLHEPTSGSIELQGSDILTPHRVPRTVRRTMQMIFQDPFASLNPRQQIGNAIGEPLVIHGLATAAEIPDIVAESLRAVGLDPAVVGSYPHEFSGGQRQRICIARALTLKPRLVVADECVSALDVSVKAQVVNLMLDLQEQFGLSYVFISHDMAVVERVSHRIAVMYLGEVVEIGPRAEIISNPQHPYTRKLLDAVLIADPAARKLQRTLDQSELKAPVKSINYVPPKREYVEISPGHLVQHVSPL